MDVDSERETTLVRHASPRFFADPPHLVEDALAALRLGKHLLLRGPTGSGKTRFAEVLAERLRLEMESVNCSVDLDLEALLGHRTLGIADGQTVVEYVEGPVVRAMRLGRMLYVDELNVARPEVLPILHGALDHRRQLTNPLTAEVVTADPRFCVVAAINEGYAGTSPLNEALLNRFVVFDVHYVQGDALAQLIREGTALSSLPQIDRFVRFSADLVRASEVGELPAEAASIRALLDACDLATQMPPLRAVRYAVAGKLSDAREQDLVIELASSYFGGT
ncbi:MoxR family ATPase [Alicyclobacillus mali]|uniref:MoxR family ATPase n=1 Tax=Alicyclobacillus mali (ex Roth et al. 2021) TaxID=1123961 RepID=A0ABS0F2G3_9BACL|nr:MoxR family ATPase [Alicyclobacillus mali (ex Roth et al. 2021)]MBF8377477.1 MoxR family ATPase [Alicyclobacillus mali (ex Roth et al. 2021)]MCL6489394.1 MoxR family ATPase [Alicyclobacillus mali (ex Roth et al. 2021)]